MKVLRGLMTALVFSSLCSLEAAPQGCHCKACHCTPTNHCGCYSKEGCHCPELACSCGKDCGKNLI